MRLKPALLSVTALCALSVAACGGSDEGPEDAAPPITIESEQAATSTTGPSGTAEEGGCALTDTRPLQLTGRFIDDAAHTGGGPPASQDEVPQDPNRIELGEAADGTVSGEWAHLSVSTGLTGRVDPDRRRITGKTVPSPHSFEDDLGRRVEISGFVAELDEEKCVYAGRFEDPDTGKFGGGVLRVPGHPDYIVRIGGRFELSLAD